ncbi:DUF6491 family protein [Phenylobacterium sp.]|uniref:DUF6491 family protein n=1 Tax=Phenylobacterium sp. TaxID=1871053 RepID=UPI0035B33D6E
MPTTIRSAASLGAVLLLASTAACASADQAKPKPESASRQCFWSRSVTSFHAVDRETVNLRVGVKDVYELKLFGPCDNVDWTEKIALESRGSSWICSGLDAVVISPSPIGPQRCMVKTIRKLTPEEVAAMPAKDKP